MFEDAILLSFIYITVCCFYVKLILNELKRPEAESDPEEINGDDGLVVEGDEVSKSKKFSKVNMVAKALFLDVFSDYVKLVIKDRKYRRRWILMLYLLINFVTTLWPYNKGSNNLHNNYFFILFYFLDLFIATFTGGIKIDTYDLDGGNKVMHFLNLIENLMFIISKHPIGSIGVNLIFLIKE